MQTLLSGWAEGLISGSSRFVRLGWPIAGIDAYASRAWARDAAPCYARDRPKAFIVDTVHTEATAGASAGEGDRLGYHVPWISVSSVT